MTTTQRPPLVCFSHLRWDFVWQRPQQLMSRFARDRRVYFIEEPVFRDDAGEPSEAGSLERREEDGIVVGQPVCREPLLHEGWRLEAMYARLLAELIRDQQLTDYTAWFYSPMFLPSIKRISPSLVVYDAMDELSLFRKAPPVLLSRERDLLQLADVVFTGGVSLGKAKAALHRNVHAFPSGVEIEHYRQALEPHTRVPADIETTPSPRIGFFGVIDERLDLELLAAAARKRPQWSFLMIGPVSKIATTELPQVANIFYLGQKQYRELPGYVKAFDVCMMPFALNDATKFISPTKTLEYMAAHKPIVSTAVADVVGSYHGAVRIAHDPDGFVAAIEEALSESAEARTARRARERAILAYSTWESIVTRMDACMRDAAQAKQQAQPPPAAAPAGGVTPAPSTPPAPRQTVGT